MRILKPKGTPLELDDKQYNLLFTVDVIDEIQEFYNEDIVTILNKMKSDERNGYGIILHVLIALIKADLKRRKEETIGLEEIQQYVTNSTAKELILLIIYTFNNDAPPPDEEELPN